MVVAVVVVVAMVVVVVLVGPGGEVDPENGVCEWCWGLIWYNGD